MGENPAHFSEKWIQYSKENLLPKEFKNLENQILQKKNMVNNDQEEETLNDDDGDDCIFFNDINDDKNELMKKNKILLNQVIFLKKELKKLKNSKFKLEKSVHYLKNCQIQDIFLSSTISVLVMSLVFGYLCFW